MKLKSELCTQTILFKEPSLKHYKYLLKSLYGETPSPDTFVETIIDIATDITDNPPTYFRDLNVVDFFLFLIDWRMLILGKDCSVIVKQEDKEMKLSLDLDLLKTDIIDAFKPFINRQIQLNENIAINFDCPSFSRLCDVFSQTTNEDYLLFIKSAIVKNGNQTHIIEIKTSKQAEELFNKLLPSASIQIIDHYTDFINVCANLNLLSRYKLKSNQTLPFTPSTQTVIWLCQLFFNESLSSIYDNLFYLSYYGKLDLNYIENGTVGEYVYFTNMLKNMLSNKNSAPQQQALDPEDEVFNQAPPVDL